MADRRRRHSTECESETEHAEPQLSEYESTADESREVVETEEDTDDEYVTEEEETAEEDEGEGDQSGVVDGERQSGDGEEQPKLDIDEDRQNPAYIPKRGAFYEHDMRLDPDEEIPVEQKDEKRGKGKLWKDDSKWSHDKFDQFAQAPKSRQELITMYGYDITQGDQPPEQLPKSVGRPRGGRRDRKPQFQDFLPEDKGRYGGNKERYSDDSYEERGPWKSKSDTSQYRGGRGRGGRGGGRRPEGGGQRRGYSDFRDDQGQRNRTYSDQDRDLKGQEKGDFRNRDFENRDRDNYNNRDGFRNRDNRENIGRRERDNFGNRDNYGNRDNRTRDSYGNRDRDNFGNRDNYGNRDRDNYGNRERNSFGNKERDNYSRKDREYSDNRDSFSGKGQAEESPYNKGSREVQDRSEGRGGFRGRGRGGFRDNRRVNSDQQGSSWGNREGGNYERQHSGGGREARNYDRQNSGGRDSENQYRRQSDSRASRNEPDSPQESARYRGTDATEGPPARSFDKPTPKSYYTLSVTDDEKLGEVEDTDFISAGVQDMNVTVTGDRRSFKERPRPQRSQDYTQQSSVEDRRDTGPPHGSGQSKHQSTLPPRLQQQQQQQERKRQKQQQAGVDKPDVGQSRSAKRYSSQRQRNVPEGPGYPEPQISQPQEQIVSSPLQQQFQPNFSPPKPAGSVQQTGIVRPTIATQINTPPQQSAVGSPTMVIPRVPPPQSMVPVYSQVPPPQVRPPPPLGPTPQGLGGPPTVFSTGTLPAGSIPSSGMPAVSVIATPLMNPAGLVHGAPPPAYQVPVPQFSANPQAQHPGETVRGGTTYYPQATPGSGPSTGTIYYSPEMQIGKQNRVQVRRPKVPLPIVRPEEIKRDKSDTSKELEEDTEDGYQADDSLDTDMRQEQIDLDTTSSDGGILESIVDVSLEQTEEYREEISDEDLESRDISETDVENVERLEPSEEISDDVEEVEERNYNNNSVSNVVEKGNEEAENKKIEEETVDENVDVGGEISEEEKSKVATDDVTDTVEKSKEESDKMESVSAETETESRSSTFVVKTDVLSPTLSVSTVIPEAENKASSDTDQKCGDRENKDGGNAEENGGEKKADDKTDSDCAMDVSKNKVDCAGDNDSSESKNTEQESKETVEEKQGKVEGDSSESFEDAVEEVS